MNKQKLIILIIIIVILIITCVLYCISQFSTNKYNNDFVIFSGNLCNLKSNKIIDKFSEKYGLRIKNSDWNVYMPCNYDFMDLEIKIAPYNPNGIYYIVDNIDIFTAKNLLWENILEKYGYERACELSPNTYILYKENDILRLQEYNLSRKKYILKKNIQRQEGLLLTDDVSKIIKERYNYVIAQDLLLNPYLIKGRKINLRVYLLIITKGNVKKAFMYNDGFMYYTKEIFNSVSLDKDSHITTGYVDRWIYDVHPLTHTDFKTYLDSDRELSESEQLVKRNTKLSIYCFSNIYYMLKDVCLSFIEKINRKQNKLYNNLCYQIFGVDVGIDNKLQAKIMEINKGPDLSPKDNRDEMLKFKLFCDMHKCVGIIPNDATNGFIELC